MATGKTPMTQGMFTSRSEEYETPQGFYNRLHSEFGFVLDAAATAHNTKCSLYITKIHNALGVDWLLYMRRSGSMGAVWLNPPYGKQIAAFMQKAYEESQNGLTVVCLVHARTDTRWFHDWAMRADEIRFVKGRLTFNEDEPGSVGAPFPSMVVVFRPMFERVSVGNVPGISTINAREDIASGN